MDFRRASVRLTALMSAIVACSVLADDKDLKSEKKSEITQPVRQTKPKSANGSGPFSSYAPAFALKDPLGMEHKSDQLMERAGMLIMITVPNLTQYEKQKRWEKLMKKETWAQNCARRVLIEDLSQQQSFKEKARATMKEKYKPADDVVVLVDEDGDIRRRFRVMNNETVILLVANDGQIVHHESDSVEPTSESMHRIMTNVRGLAESTPAARTEKSTMIMASPLASGK